MNLLLRVNNLGYGDDEKPVTMIMVTHNPDLECYADRVLYIKDGTCVKQCLNAVQCALDYDQYLHYLKASNGPS